MVKPVKIFSGRSLNFVKINDLEHYRELECFKVYTNDNPGLALTFFMASFNLPAYVFARANP